MIVFPDVKNCTIAVIGDIILDRYIWGNVSRISPEAPVPVVKVKRKTTNLGGAGNVAMNLKGLGCKPILIGTRGADQNGAAMMQLLAQENITHHILTIPDHITTTKTRIIGQRQQVVRLDEENVDYMTTTAYTEWVDQLGSILESADAVIISDYGKGLMTHATTEKIIQDCRNHQIPVFVDPKGATWKQYRHATCITPNIVELQLVAPFDENDESELENKANALMKILELDFLLVTKGAQGMTLMSQAKGPVRIPVKAKEVFDVSGAGDTVIATLAATFAAGIPMEDAADCANRAAGIVVGKIGTQPIETFELKQLSMGEPYLNRGKIVTSQVALSMIESWREDGKIIVFTNGCFDILHVGHVKLLHAAAKEGDKLIVGLNSDASISRIKGDQRPIVSEVERATLLAGIKGVDLVVLFDEETPIDLIERFEPDVLVKGGDYSPETVVGHDVVSQKGGSVVIVPLIEGFSTTRIIESLKSNLS